MQLGGPSPDQFGHAGGDDVVSTVVRGQHVVDGETQFVEHLHPEIALVGDSVVDDHDVRRSRFAGKVDVERRGQAGDPVETGRAEVGRKFHIGVGACLEAADELGDQSTVDDR